MNNKKGTTLVELIISLALISVILVFMVKMVIDINDTVTNSDFAKDNQIKRAEIIRNIETELNSKTIKGVKNLSNDNKLKIQITFSDDKTSTILADANSISYTDSTINTRRWRLSDKESVYLKPTIDYKPDPYGTYTLIINIEIHTVNDRNTECNNNIIDDITISYIGNFSDVSTIDVLMPNNC